jgi:hypothetical protein
VAVAGVAVVIVQNGSGFFLLFFKIFFDGTCETLALWIEEWQWSGGSGVNP